MDFVYGIIWLVIAFLLIFKMSKENKIFVILGLFFIIMGVWWILNGALPNVEMLEGTMGWILRGIGAVFLAIAGVFYFKNIYKRND